MVCLIMTSRTLTLGHYDFLVKNEENSVHESLSSENHKYVSSNFPELSQKNNELLHLKFLIDRLST